MSGREQGDLALRAALFGVEAGRGVERQVQQRHAGPAVAQHRPLLAHAAQEQTDGDRVGFGGVGVEQFRRQVAGRAGLRDEGEVPW
ncbi:hypothetical protein GCM10010228_55290 [Streptomyces massasporeus]|nr:hypothetical protein GCM10010228_55290 [Streptomyces massasporeus]